MNDNYLKSKLYEKIQGWADEVNETDEWLALDVWWGDDTIKHMVDVVFSLILACAESQQYRKREDADR